MSNRKTQNSILFLTTLSVYLGLLVVGGAAPQVFAHSATTRNFEISDEIEITDDLDNKPDDECEDREKLSAEASKFYASIGLGKHGRTFVTNYISDFFTDLVDELKDNPQNRSRTFSAEFLVEQLKRRYEDVQITSKIRNDFRYSGTYRTKADFFAESLFPFLEEISRVACSSDGDNCSPVEINISLDESEFSSSIRFQTESEKFAQIFVKAYDLENRYESCFKGTSFLVFRNTKAYAENRQVAIVTRLPRAALDTLLTKNAK